MRSKVILLFSLLFLGLLYIPFYYQAHSLNLGVLLIFAFTYLASIVSINLGWHRYYSHQLFDLHPVLKIIFLFFGTSVFFGKISEWVSEHQAHHFFLGTPKDPQRAHQGFFSRAYWMIWHTPKFNFKNPHARDKIFTFFDRHWVAMTILSNLSLILISTLASKDFLQSLLLVGILRVNLVFHLYTLTHALGHGKMDKHLHFLNGGEGVHEFHHEELDKINEGRNLTNYMLKFLIKIKLIKMKNYDKKN